MTGRARTLRLLLDESVPRSVGRVFEEDGHEVVYFEDALMKGSADPAVRQTAIINGAILVAIDNDMKEAAKRQNIGGRSYKKLSLIKISCRETHAASRVNESLRLIKDEWELSENNPNNKRYVYIEIGESFIKTNR